MRIKKAFAPLAAGALALLLLATPALADDPDPSEGGGSGTGEPATQVEGVSASDVKIVKHVQASPEAPIANDRFTFTFQGLGYEDADGNLVSGSSAPSIPNLTTPAVGEMDSNTQDIEATGISFPANFPHAGVFQYEVTEYGSSTQIITTGGHNYHPSQAKYLMRVYVVNNGDNLSISRVTMQVETPDYVYGDEPTDEQNETVDEKVSQMDFTNRYDGRASLVIRKDVTGDYGDKEKLFTFSVKLIVPDSMMGVITTTQSGVGSAGATVPAIEAYGRETTAAPESHTDRWFLFGYSKAAGADYSTAIPLGDAHVAILTGIQLADGDRLSFNGDLPVGTRYEIIETGETGYTASAITYNKSDSPTEADKTATQPAAGTSGADYTVSAGENTAVTTAGAVCVITNDYKEVTPTGVLVANLPYVILVGIPVAAGAVWFVLRRRSLSKRQG